MSQYQIDNAWQRGRRDEILAPEFYGKWFAGRYQFQDVGLAAQSFQERGVDTVVRTACGDHLWIEEKIVRKHTPAYTAFCLETKSCTTAGHESEGWMRYSVADRLLYCFEQADGALDCHLILFQPLKAWFWAREDKFPHFRLTTVPRSFGRIVPIAQVEKAGLINWRGVLGRAEAKAA